MNDLPSIPRPVIQRLPKYLSHALELQRAHIEWVSSHDLSRSLGLTSSTVRQDLSHLALTGVSKRGYETDQLKEALGAVLGTQEKHRLVIVGAGYLGSAVALHGGLPAYGFETCGIFDADKDVVGTEVGSLKVRPMSQLRALIQRKKVDIGLIAVPVTAAQEVADVLVKAGINGLLNLAYVHIRVPPHVHLVDARLLASLQELAYLIREGGSLDEHEAEDPNTA